jgi:cobalt-zinc-cadmium efflux system membrane fusion protein
MNTRLSTLHVVFLILATSAACNRTDEPAPPAPPAASEPDRGEEAAEASDLDQPIAQLLARTCEHHKKMFECDDCRYEVGVARAPTSLTDEGLLTTVTAERRKVAVPIALTGEVRFDERRVGHVSSQVEGIVKRVHVALGDAVVAGQPLMEIESVVVGEAQADFFEAQGMRQLARRSLERVTALRSENIASEKELLQAQRDFDAARIRSDGAMGKLKRLGTDYGGEGRLTLRAPMDGAVLVMHAVSGEVAKTDESLITVGDNTRVWVWADLYERDIAQVTLGQAAQKLTASVSVKAYPGMAFPGTVDLVSPAMDESSRTVKVRVDVASTERRLLAGMFAAVQVYLPGMDETLAVPRVAVLEDEGRSFVFVHLQGEFYVRRPVTTGRTWAGWVEITQGLQPGQVVVAEGAFLLKSDVLRSKMGAGCAD